jgi:hypothetical protein
MASPASGPFTTADGGLLTGTQSAVPVGRRAAPTRSAAAR